MKTYFISTCITIVFGIVSYIFGQRSGKNQADRSKLQELYKTLLVELQDFMKALERDVPKRWSDYEKRETREFGEYLPPAKKMENNGDAVFLKKEIFDNCLELERDVLNFASAYDMIEEEIHLAVKRNIGRIAKNYRYKKADYIKADENENHIEIGMENHSIRSVLFKYKTLIEPQEGNRVIETINNGEGVIFHKMSGNRISYSLTINPKSLIVSGEEFLELIKKETDDSYRQFEENKGKLLSRIEQNSDILRKRAREPITFCETVVSAINDAIGRQK